MQPQGLEDCEVYSLQTQRCSTSLQFLHYWSRLKKQAQESLLSV
jgi:hypothetical protein